MEKRSKFVEATLPTRNLILLRGVFVMEKERKNTITKQN